MKMNEQSTPPRKNIALLIIFISMIGFVFYSIIQTLPRSQTNIVATGESLVAAAAKKQREEMSRFTITDLRKQKGQFGAEFFAGTLTNNTDKTYSYVQIEINLYDKAGIQIGSTLANINNMEPQAKWKFNAPIFSPEAVADAKVMNITAF